MAAVRSRRTAASKARQALKNDDGDTAPLDDHLTPPQAEGDDEDFEAPVDSEPHVHVSVGYPTSKLPLPNELLLSVVDLLAEKDIVNIFRLLGTSRGFYHLIEGDEKGWKRRAKAIGAKHKKPRSSWLLTFVDKYLKQCKECRGKRPNSKLRGRPHPYFRDEPKNVYVCAACQKAKGLTLRYGLDTTWPQSFVDRAQAFAHAPIFQGRISALNAEQVWLACDLDNLQEELDEQRGEDLERAIKGLVEEDQEYLRELISSFDDVPPIYSFALKNCVEKLWDKRFEEGRTITADILREVIDLARKRSAVKNEVCQEIKDKYAGEQGDKMLLKVEENLKTPHRAGQTQDADHLWAYFAIFADTWHDCIAQGSATKEEFVNFLARLHKYDSL